jgi:hypothetical protein
MDEPECNNGSTKQRPSDCSDVEQTQWEAYAVPAYGHTYKLACWHHQEKE